MPEQDYTPRDLIRLALAMAPKDLPDETQWSIGYWTEPVPGWHLEFTAMLGGLTTADLREALAEDPTKDVVPD